MPIENLMIMIRNRNSIWQKHEEKTTVEERKEIVEYCINHDRSYKDSASKYDISYRHVYSWVKKYDANGVHKKYLHFKLKYRHLHTKF